MSPVSPIPNHPPIPMPAGVHPAGQDRKRDADRERPGDDRPDERKPEAPGPAEPERSQGPGGGISPDDPGQIIDVKA